MDLTVHPTAEVHPTAVVDLPVAIGPSTCVWHFSHIMQGARVGRDCTIGQGCFVGRGVIIGDGVKLQNNVSVFEGVVLEDDVFCGPGLVFTNVKNPRAAVSRRAEFRTTRVRRGATLGANATILPGLELGEHCFVAAGATVTRDIPPFALVAGTPARPVGWMSRHGERLRFDPEGRARCPESRELYRLLNGGARVERVVDDKA